MESIESDDMEEVSCGGEGAAGGSSSCPMMFAYAIRCAHSGDLLCVCVGGGGRALVVMSKLLICMYVALWGHAQTDLSLLESMSPYPLQEVTEVGNMCVLLDIVLTLTRAAKHVLHLQTDGYH